MLLEEKVGRAPGDAGIDKDFLIRTVTKEEQQQ